ncbi:unnamed protein product [Cuscuta campestris]|uniref:HAT C-terminal dimerisation domain-containing protein n=1 Tax=Cuscuta campestris TaxID=132261 RepID=A0A484MTU3_9ASTE|nr:unnamed protein product [Cuscuta campestris]
MVPGMGFLYGCMDRAKEEISENLGQDFGFYNEIWKIIDKRWELQLHRDLHAAAYYLNPRFQYDPEMSTNAEVKAGLFRCMAKIFPDPKIQEKLHLQMDDFRLKRGFFGHDVAQNTVHKRSPVDWWTQYGDETPELMTCAIRILNLTCSSSACERNWSTFNQIHMKKRNRLHTKNLNKMVYVMNNKRLKSKWMKKASLKVEEDPLVMDKIPSDDEWVVHEDDMIVESDDVHGDGPEVHTQGDTASETITNPSGQRRNKGHPSKRRRLGKRKALQLIDEVEEDEEDDIILRDPIRDDFFINSEEEN